MKNVLLLLNLLLCFCSTGYAKKASGTWFFFQKSSTSVLEDGNIRFYCDIIENNGTKIPYPTIEIFIENKTTETLYVDLEKSLIRINNTENPIYPYPSNSKIYTGGIGIAIKGTLGNVYSKIVSVPAESSITLNNIPLLSEKYAGTAGMFYNVKNWGKMAFIYSQRMVDRGDFLDYNEKNTPISFEFIIDYSLSEYFSDEHTLSMGYFCTKIIGATLLHINANKDVEIVSKIFPEWLDKIQNNDLEIMRLGTL